MRVAYWAGELLSILHCHYPILNFLAVIIVRFKVLGKG